MSNVECLLSETDLWMKPVFLLREKPTGEAVTSMARTLLERYIMLKYI